MQCSWLSSTISSRVGSTVGWRSVVPLLLHSSSSMTQYVWIFLSLFSMCPGGTSFPFITKAAPYPGMPSLPFCFSPPRSRTPIFFPHSRHEVLLIWVQRVPIYLDRPGGWQCEGSWASLRTSHIVKLGCLSLFLKVSLLLPHLDFGVLALGSARPQRNGPRQRMILKD